MVFDYREYKWLHDVIPKLVEISSEISRNLSSIFQSWISTQDIGKYVIVSYLWRHIISIYPSAHVSNNLPSISYYVFNVVMTESSKQTRWISFRNCSHRFYLHNIPCRMSAVQTEYIDPGVPTAETLSWLLVLPLIDLPIIHWERNKMADICQTIFWNAMFGFWFTFGITLRVWDSLEYNNIFYYADGFVYSEWHRENYVWQQESLMKKTQASEWPYQ